MSKLRSKKASSREVTVSHCKHRVSLTSRPCASRHRCLHPLSNKYKPIQSSLDLKTPLCNRQNCRLSPLLSWERYSNAVTNAQMPSPKMTRGLEAKIFVIRFACTSKHASSKGVRCHAAIDHSQLVGKEHIYSCRCCTENSLVARSLHHIHHVLRQCQAEQNTCKGRCFCAPERFAGPRFGWLLVPAAAAVAGALVARALDALKCCSRPVAKFRSRCSTFLA